MPLGYRGMGAQQILVPNDPMVEQCWAEMEPVQGVVPSGNREARHRVVLPLRVGNRMIGVAVSSAIAVAPDSATVSDADARGRRGTACASTPRWSSTRSARWPPPTSGSAWPARSTTASPRRWPRSGYVVDHMASTTRDPDVAQGLRELRGELSRVVADLRLSIFDLRSDVSATNGLGSALSDYVRQVGAKSDLTVHLTLNEAPTRLSPAVEAELLRIAQEAITNARKHASARNLWVDCWTDPPQREPDGAGRRSRHHRAPRRLLRHLDHAGTGPAHRCDARSHQRVRRRTSGAGTVVQRKVAEKSVLTTEGL